jgi:large subunit ribosomal protein L10
VVLRLEDKKQVVADVAIVAKNASSAIAAEYRGLSVGEMTELRTIARSRGVTVRVIRNTLAKRAFEGTQYESIKDKLTGPLILAFSGDEPGSAAKLFHDFSKDHEKLIVKAISLNGQVVDVSELSAVASLPTKDQAISMLMSVMQAPITKFVRTLAEPHTKLVRLFAAVRDKKQQSE